MRNYRRFALATAAATYFLIFVGGLVRVAGAGMGCPDWPKCFGRWTPPLSIIDLPPNIDPATFNVTLAWIEWTNRLVGMTVGFLILGVAIMALRHYRRTPGVVWPSLAAAVLVAVQGWQGSVVVASELQPFVVTIHMVLALVIVSLLIYAVMKSYADTNKAHEVVSGNAGRARLMARVLWIATIVQIILGSQVREAVESAATRLPLLSAKEWLEAAGSLEDVHFILGVGLLALTYFLSQMVRRMTPHISKLAKVTVQTMLVLVFLQAISGIALQTAGLPALVDLFHLWLAAMFVGLAMVLHAEISRPSPALAEKVHIYRRVIIVGCMLLVLTGGLAYVVIEQAEDSRCEQIRQNLRPFDSPAGTETFGTDVPVADLSPLQADYLAGKITVVVCTITRFWQNTNMSLHSQKDIRALKEILAYTAHSELVQFLAVNLGPDSLGEATWDELRSDLKPQPHVWRQLELPTEELYLLLLRACARTGGGITLTIVFETDDGKFKLCSARDHFSRSLAKSIVYLARHEL